MAGAQDGRTVLDHLTSASKENVMPHHARRVAIASAVTVLAAMAAGPAHATLPGQNGPIVYWDQVGDHHQVFTMGPEGGPATQLTHVTGADATNAAWAPDASRLVFEQDFADSARIFTMRPDGSDVRSLTPTGLQGMPAYSPNGRRIVFDRTLPDEDALWTMKADGSDLRQVTHNRKPGKGECRCEGSPVYSPRSDRIAFVRSIDDQRAALFSVRPDGSGLRRLTPWSMGVAGKVDWSPDGRRILFSSPQFERPNTTANVYTMRPDGTGLVQLTHDTDPKIDNGADSYSPDGTKILFAGNRTGSFQIYAMGVDGSDPVQLTHGTDAHWANWGRQR